MSQILHTINSIVLNTKNIRTIVNDYEHDLLNYEERLTMVGKTIEHCLKEQPQWTAYYAERKVEIKSIVAWLETQIKKVRAQLYIQYNEHHSRALGDRTIDKYIDREDEYLNYNSYLLEFQEILGKYEMLLDAFNKRGFALRDIVQSRINSIQHDIL
jgi:hypothetical protein